MLILPPADPGAFASDLVTFVQSLDLSEAHDLIRRQRANPSDPALCLLVTAYHWVEDTLAPTVRARWALGLLTLGEACQQGRGGDPTARASGDRPDPCHPPSG